MPAHKFSLGQTLAFAPSRMELRQAAASLFEVTRLLPSDGSEWLYRIRNAQGGVERVARESQLSRP